MLYYVTLLRGYRLGDLSVVYPLARGTGPLLTAVVATTFLGETLSIVGWLGVLGIVGGIVIIAGGPALLRALRRGGHSNAELGRLRAGIRYGITTGAFIAGYTLIDGYAVKHAGMSPVLVDYLSNLVRLPLTVILIVVLARREPLPLAGYAKQMWRPALIIGALSPIGYVMVLYAVGDGAAVSSRAGARSIDVDCRIPRRRTTRRAEPARALARRRVYCGRGGRDRNGLSIGPNRVACLTHLGADRGP